MAIEAIEVYIWIHFMDNQKISVQFWMQTF